MFLDTDSILIALGHEQLIDAVKPEKLAEWPDIKKKWFAEEEPKHPTQKIPGYLKEEFRSVDGYFVGLSSKCYILTKPDEIKRSQKGTPRELEIPLDKFLACLLKNEIPLAKYGTIMQDKKHGSCVTKIITKRALNPIYYKHFVSDNCIDVTPFKSENKFY